MNKEEIFKYFEERIRHHETLAASHARINDDYLEQFNLGIARGYTLAMIKVQKDLEK